MTVLAQKKNPDYAHGFENDYVKLVESSSTSFTHRQLSNVFNSSLVIPFDHKTPLVFFSDCHRGIRERVDPFTRNELLYYHVLKKYYQAGYTYVEVGDGDEMYKYSFNQIQSHYGYIYQLLHDFNRRERLIMILGNHDLGTTHQSAIEKDGIIAREGVILENSRTKQQLFVVHGHQADILSECFRPLGRALVRYLLDPLFKMGLVGLNNNGEPCYLGHHNLPAWLTNYIEHSQETIENRIAGWVRENRQMLICGHTHCFRASGINTVPYFNTGSCLVPDVLTGFEIFKGKISQIKWTLNKTAAGGAARLNRTLLSEPKDIISFAG